MNELQTSLFAFSLMVCFVFVSFLVVEKNNVVKSSLVAKES